MNDDVRKRTAIGGAVLALVAALAIAPEAASNLVLHHTGSKDLWWGALTAVFAGIAVLLEALEVGRNPRHRGRVNDMIVREVIGTACPRSDCPLKSEPNESARRAAMAIFYSRIDQPSRDVAFYQWGWFYTSLIWTWLALAGLVLAFTLSWFKETHNNGLRWSAIVFLALSAVLAYAISKTWESKTLDHAEMQLIQIRQNIGTRLDGTECPDQNCPAT